jgi:hypothetical protein
MSHRDVASVAEPWLLLPLLYATRRNGVIAEYSHRLCSQAIHGFIQQLPGRELEWKAAIRGFSVALYGKHCREGERYFLDKTPRYFLLAQEIMDVFPDAKFVYLFRNPVHVFASIVDTWAAGRLNRLRDNWIDLNAGPRLLSESYRLSGGRSYGIRYEDLVLDPGPTLSGLCQYLEIDFNESMLDKFASQIMHGKLGDKTGSARYSNITPTPLEGWKKCFSTRFRKGIVRRYITSIGQKDLKTLGYDLDSILSEIDRLPNAVGALIDIPDYLFSLAKVYFARYTGAASFPGATFKPHYS